MSRSLRGVLAALTLLPLLALLSAPSAVAAPAAQAGPGGAVQEFGACLSEQKKGDLLLLLDQSGSLKQTDPDDVRVTASAFLLKQLSQTAGAADAALDVAVAGFDVTYQRTVPWQRLDDRSLPGVVDGVEAYRDRDSGVDTDYVNAIAGARDELRARQRGGADRCQVLVWFSDGEFDVDVRNDAKAAKYGATKSYAPGVDLRSEAGTARAVTAGTAALCRTGGVADQLRAGDVLTFAVGLGQQEQYGLMRKVAVGADPQAGPCGKQPAGVVGDFRAADQVSDLVFALNNYTGLVPPVDSTSGVCARTACAGAARTFVLDASIRDVDVLAGTTAPKVDILLSGPGGGAPARFHFTAPGEVAPQTVSGQQVRAEWLSDRQVQIDLSRSTLSGWSGQWTLVPVAPQGAPPGTKARTQLRITGDLVPRLEGAPELRADADTRVTLGIASERDGEPVPVEQVLGTARVSARLVSAGGKATPVAEAVGLTSAAKGLPVDLRAFPPGPAVLELRLAVQTAGTTVGGKAVPGTRLAERRTDLPVTVLPPREYPRVTAEELDLGKREGVGPHAAVLPLAGPGCVWLERATVETGPEGTGAALTSTARSADTCVEVGAKGELPLELALDESGNGTLSGLLTVRLAPKGETGKSLATTVPFVGDLVRPVDTKVLGLAFALALLLGIGLPLLFLYVLRWWTARIPGEALRVGTVPVTLVGRDVQRDGAPFTLDLAQDTRFQGVPDGGVRRLDVEGLVLQTRSGASPTSAPWTEVTAAGSVVVTAEGKGRLPLGVHGSWVALLDPARTSEARVVVLLPTHASPALLEQVAREVRSRLPELAAEARDADGTPGGGSPAPVGAPG
ncbi:MAG: hypothetical protein JWO60_2916, partial [Frankiales bacterium]|nr:hypothetical protein [Frankiales bacterium]